MIPKAWTSADLIKRDHFERLKKNMSWKLFLMQITELSKEVFRLKEALGSLSPPLGITSTHQGNPGQRMALQNRVAVLSQQLQVPNK